MVLSADEGKARRLAGLKREKLEQTPAERIHRALTTGRPPAGEFKTPLTAIHAAKVLDNEIDLRLQVEGFSSDTADHFVCVGYITPDLTTVGFTQPYAPERENDMTRFLLGNIALGLVFGVVDREQPEPIVVMGARPFFTTKQTEGWLDGLLPIVSSHIEGELVARGRWNE